MTVAEAIKSFLLWSSWGICLLVAGLLGLLFLFDRPSRSKDEPYIIRPLIPSIGHLYGFLGYGSLYFTELASQANHKIFSINIFGLRLHITADPLLNSAIHREKAISLDPIVLKIAKSVVGDSPMIISLMQPTASGDSSQYNHDIYNTLHDPLRPGPQLWTMNERVLACLSKLVNSIGTEWETKDFWLYIRNTFTSASSEAIFGIHHPINKASLIDDLWAFDEQQMVLMGLRRPFTALFPAARKALRSHERIISALHHYHELGHYNHSSVSAMVSTRIEVNLKHGVPLQEISNSSHSHLFVSTTNAVPLIFWVLLYVWSNEELVQHLRYELEGSDVIFKHESTIRIDHTRLTTCELLCAAYWETMRLANVQPGIKAVTEDIVIRTSDKNSGYRLKKGSLIASPSCIVHRSKRIWGPDALDFRPSRWLSLTKEQKKAFMPFGGGKHLCPGRDFAFAEIVGALAVFVMGFELRGTDGRTVKMPEGRTNKYGVLGPDREGRALKILIKRRGGWGDITWEFGSRPPED